MGQTNYPFPAINSALVLNPIINNQIMNRFFFITSLFVLCVSLAWGQAPSDAILGTWTNPEKDARFLISKQGEQFSGKMVWVNAPTAKPPIDDKNPDASLRNRPLLGLQILKGFSYAGDHVWEDGKIYDPRNGKTYSCKLTLTDPKHLNVRGYVGFSLLGRTEIWTRVE